MVDNVLEVAVRVTPGTSEQDSQEIGRRIAANINQAASTAPNTGGESPLVGQFREQGEKAGAGFAAALNNAAHRAGGQGGGQTEQIGKSAETAAKGFETLTRGIEGAAAALSGASFAQGAQALEGLGRNVGSLATGATGLAGALGPVGAILAGATAALVAWKVAEFEVAEHTAEAVNDFNELARATGMTRAEFAQLEIAAKDAGLPIEALHQVVRRTSMRIQEDWGDVAKSVRDSADEQTSAALAVADAQRKVQDAYEGTGASVRKEHEAERAVAEAQFAPAEEQRTEAGLARDVQTKREGIEGAERNVHSTQLDLFRAQLAYRQQYEGQPIDANDRERLRTLEQQAAREHIEDLQTKEAQAERAVPAAREEEQAAEEKQAIQGRFGPQEAADKQTAASDALAESKRKEATASDEVTKSLIALTTAQHAQSDALLKNPQYLSQAIKAGGGGIDWSNVAPGDIFKALMLTGAKPNPQTGELEPSIPGTLGAAHQFFNLPNVQDTLTSQAVTAQFGGRNNLVQLQEMLKAGGFAQPPTPEAERRAAGMEQAEQPARQVRSDIGELGLSVRDEAVRAFGGMHLDSVVKDISGEMTGAVHGIATGAVAISGATDKLSSAISTGASNVEAAIARLTAALRPPNQAAPGQGAADQSQPAKAEGGLISGPGGPTSDVIPIWSSAGEYVVKAQRVAEEGVDALHAFNRGEAKIVRYAEGGLVGYQQGGMLLKSVSSDTPPGAIPQDEWPQDPDTITPEENAIQQRMMDAYFAQHHLSKSKVVGNFWFQKDDAGNFIIHAVNLSAAPKGSSTGTPHPSANVGVQPRPQAGPIEIEEPPPALAQPARAPTPPHTATPTPDIKIGASTLNAEVSDRLGFGVGLGEAQVPKGPDIGPLIPRSGFEGIQSASRPGETVIMPETISEAQVEKELGSQVPLESHYVGAAQSGDESGRAAALASLRDTLAARHQPTPPHTMAHAPVAREAIAEASAPVAIEHSHTPLAVSSILGAGEGGMKPLLPKIGQASPPSHMARTSAHGEDKERGGTTEHKESGHGSTEHKTQAHASHGTNAGTSALGAGRIGTSTGIGEDFRHHAVIHAAASVAGAHAQISVPKEIGREHGLSEHKHESSDRFTTIQYHVPESSAARAPTYTALNLSDLFSSHAGFQDGGYVDVATDYEDRAAHRASTSPNRTGSLKPRGRIEPSFRSAAKEGEQAVASELFGDVKINSEEALAHSMQRVAAPAARSSLGRILAPLAGELAGPVGFFGSLAADIAWPTPAYAEGGLVQQAVQLNLFSQDEASVMSDDDLRAAIATASKSPSISLPSTSFFSDFDTITRGIGTLLGKELPAVDLNAPRQFEKEESPTTPMSLTGAIGLRELRERLAASTTSSGSPTWYEPESTTSPVWLFRESERKSQDAAQAAAGTTEGETPAQPAAPLMGPEGGGTQAAQPAGETTAAPAGPASTATPDLSSNFGRVPQGWESRIALAPGVNSFWDVSSSSGAPQQGQINWASNFGRVPQGWESRIALAPGVKSWWDTSKGTPSASPSTSEASNFGRVPQGWESRIVLAPGVKSWWDMGGDSDSPQKTDPESYAEGGLIEALIHAGEGTGAAAVAEGVAASEGAAATETEAAQTGASAAKSAVSGPASGTAHQYHEPSLKPYTPSWSERVRAGAQDAISWLGGSKTFSQEFGERTANIAGFTPFVGSALSANQAYRDYQSGHYVSAGLNLAAALPIPATALGMHGIERTVSEVSGMLVDETGSFGGRMARIADHKALEIAKSMNRAGSEPRAIWDKTGWFQGADKEWRFEIPDNEVKLKKPVEAIEPHQALRRLPAIISDPALFEAYPKLKGVTIELGDTSGRGAYQSSKFNAGNITLSKGNESNLSTILHETQHAVQRQEGFAVGASPNTPFFSNFPAQVLAEEYKHGLIKPEMGVDDPKTIQEWAKWEAYRRSAGEVEARNVQHRMDWTPAQRKATPPWETEDVPREQQIVQFGGGTHFAQSANLKIPPAWTNVQIMPPGGDIVAMGRDAKGKLQQIYSEEHQARVSAEKFARVGTLNEKFSNLMDENTQNRLGSDPVAAEHAEVTELIAKTGVRPGSTADTGARKQAYGATTLLGQHVVAADDGGAMLRFVGKKGVDLSIPVSDPELAGRMLERANRAGPEGQLFPQVNDASLRDYVANLSSQSGFLPKDFRTRLANEKAREAVAAMQPPTDPKSLKQATTAVARTVSSTLGNTPAVALKSYIDPQVFHDWQLGDSDKQHKFAEGGMISYAAGGLTPAAFASAMTPSLSSIGSSAAIFAAQRGGPESAAALANQLFGNPPSTAQLLSQNAAVGNALYAGVPGADFSRNVAMPNVSTQSFVDNTQPNISIPTFGPQPNMVGPQVAYAPQANTAALGTGTFQASVPAVVGFNTGIPSWGTPFFAEGGVLGGRFSANLIDDLSDADRAIFLAQFDPSIATNDRKYHALKNAEKLVSSAQSQVWRTPLFASGGLNTSDRIPILASNGEYIVNADRVAHEGVDALHALNQGVARIVRYARGGEVSDKWGELIEPPARIPRYAEGGIIGESRGSAMDWLTGPERYANGGLVLAPGGDTVGSSPTHIIDLRTDVGTFRMQASTDTVQKMQQSAIAARMTTTGTTTWRT